MEGQNLGNLLIFKYLEKRVAQKKEEEEAVKRELSDPLPWSTQDGLEAACLFMERELMKDNVIEKGTHTFDIFSKDFPPYTFSEEKWKKLSTNAKKVLTVTAVNSLFLTFCKRHPEIVPGKNTMGEHFCTIQPVSAGFDGTQIYAFTFSWQ